MVGIATNVKNIAPGNQRQNTSAGSGTTSRAARATTWLLPHNAAVAIRANVPNGPGAALIPARQNVRGERAARRAMAAVGVPHNRPGKTERFPPSRAAAEKQILEQYQIDL